MYIVSRVGLFGLSVRVHWCLLRRTHLRLANAATSFAAPHNYNHYPSPVSSPSIMGHVTLPEELIEQIVEDLFAIASLRDIFLARGISGKYLQASQ
jgi:hypothetical protein